MGNTSGTEIENTRERDGIIGTEMRNTMETEIENTSER